MTAKQVAGLSVALGTALASSGLVAQGTGPFAESGWDLPVHDDEPYAQLLMDRFEYQDYEDEEAFAWEGSAWFGTDRHRLLVQSEGEAELGDGDGGEVESLDVQYANRIGAYWDAKAGLGYQTTFGPGPDRDRASALVGVQGLAPYWFEVDANLRVSEDGDTVAEFEGEYDWLFTQRLILQGRGETSYAFSEVPEFGVGEGINGLTLGLRLRYEFRREIAPYVGVRWQKDYGDTADLTRAEGEDTENSAVVAGVRWWF
ncbi:copper resistance protein CopB [Halovibrio salipaludis]|uniref:Copper resistance protein CopB n=1 Tax=Halovibrio salipaludis TaxID=2032626 RepID=A0A2A2F7G5_9GAMM|nr:copper resistance protein B [Halovibrio salipaludis]PAU80760.1 copper resistance protein CopB [Halovibrio salipaludis]